jgi:hypothetical protein
MLYPSLRKLSDKAAEGLHREPGVVGARLWCFLIQEKAPAWTARPSEAS